MNIRKHLLIIFSISIIPFLIAFSFLNAEPVKRSDIITINGTIKDVRLHHSGKRGKGQHDKSLVFKLKEYPDFKFKLESIVYTFLNDGGISAYFQENDFIRFSILKTDFQKKISKTVSTNILDEIWFYEQIEIVDLRRDTVYLSLANYNASHRSNNLLVALVFAIMGIAIIGIGIGERNYRKRKQQLTFEGLTGETNRVKKRLEKR